MTKEIKNLEKGVLRIYESDGLELMAYDTKDPLGDQAILIKNNDTLISIEAPLFKSNVKEINDYVESLDVKNQYVLLVDHVAVKDYLPKAKLITAKNALNALTSGEPKGLYNNFLNIFGDSINAKLREDYDVVDNKFNIKGIELELFPRGNDFNVYIPKFNAIYTHMLGHDVHSIIAGKEHALAMIEELNSFLDSGYELILTSHYVPETKEDVKTKISYVENILKINECSSNKEEFLNNVKKEYPNYSGLNYLDMTAGFFYK